ncbi:MAG: hypothetical protein H8E34_07860 [Bacteroidetes bacterium]|nr:hypothetical protein [Bacteroidota bacterium]
MTEYCEGYPVEIVSRGGRLVIEAMNQCGSDCTHVDLIELIKWIKNNKPELLEV